MPAYNASGPVTAIYPGDSALVLNAESPTTGSKSVQLAIGSVYENAPPKLSLELTFSAAPGAFNYQIQVADTDADANYVTLANAGTIIAVNANNLARVDLSPILGKFVRLYTAAQTGNVVTATAKFSR